ncbi:MAG TPA: (4Fe-4S)-binding protein [Deltaproteobacteria bacterium]|nr:MAG: hypothetical protein A2Z79_03905 [Deltaproteobacteria bacterium GWA2_55_82]OGQ64075.1 MAG: hypothetical protein A3I81_10280 [Deltaproteobacteria bacterium RIFCSPLOWO2_02_FULL_55_12]OIJ74525.1 MAG: hypothetical protein A2V21_309805 [Deltaproteobacteria bacterium GWC2_55_46]HBG47188.1 (4Fe-4S)-binding protein [Deltaproteobacteria bacterium]HCY10750.1 (4Fe-4S)-binding protein [Deltaproteobacteria bacterium]
MSRVAIKRCRSYERASVEASVTEAVTLLGGIAGLVKRGERILVKPNLLAAKPPEAAVTTHPEVVRAVLILIKEAGATPVVGDSPGFGTARGAAEKSGILSACRELGVEVIELKTLTIAANPGGHTFKRLDVASEALECDGIVNVPKLKTHAQMYLTMAVKNLFGCVPGKLKPQWHLSAGVSSAHFADMLLDLCLFLSPKLTVMDAIVGMEGNGPGSGTPRELGLVFAGTDCVAMDAAAAGVLGACHDDVPVLKAAKRRGLPSRPQDVEALGEELSAISVKGFVFPPQMNVNFASFLPGFLDGPLRKALTSRPGVDPVSCTMCGICVGVCPAEVMTKARRIEIDYNRCIRCYCCQEMCPKGAISPRNGWLKRLIPGL